MTEDEARAWVLSRYGSGAMTKLEQLCIIVTAEASRQNLVARSTLPMIWNRHIVDSAQLLDLAPTTKDEQWIDIGSGAGFPGLIVAALAPCAVLMVEPRRRRATFLEEAVAVLGLTSAAVVCGRIEAVTSRASLISARAVAPLTTLLEWGEGCASSATKWVLPKGRSAREEVATARQAWHGVFHVEQSITDPESMIVVATGVTRR